MLKSALRDIANRRTKGQGSETKSQAPSLDDHHSKKEELESVVNCQKYVHKLS